jgi:hypothetical protein
VDKHKRKRKSSMDTNNRHRETHRKHCEQDTAQKHENIKNTIQKAKKMRGPGADQ